MRTAFWVLGLIVVIELVIIIYLAFVMYYMGNCKSPPGPPYVPCDFCVKPVPPV